MSYGQYHCIYYAIVQNLEETHLSEIDSIQVTRIDQTFLFVVNDSVRSGVSRKTMYPLDSVKVDSEIGRVKNRWNKDSVIFKQNMELWITLYSNEYHSLIDSTIYFEVDKYSCWGEVTWYEHKNKIKRNKVGQVLKVKSKQYSCEYEYDQNEKIKSILIKYKGNDVQHEHSPGYAEFSFDQDGKIIIIKTQPYYSKSSELDFFLVKYFD